MRTITSLLLVLFAATLLTGCGASKSADQQASAPTAAPEQPQLAPSPRPQGDGPDVAVYDFLEAVRKGNDSLASQMLTPLARQKVAEQHMVVAPPGTDTARFEVGATEKLAEDAARVTIKWIDLDENNKPRADDVIWMVRKVAEGWRIAGAAVPVFPGEAPMVLNFEDPEDMVRKQKAVRDEMRRRSEQAVSQSQQQPTQPMGEQPSVVTPASAQVEQAANPQAPTRR